MKKLCPNLDREDGLDTVLEVPIPDDASTFAPHGKGAENSPRVSWGNVMKGWMRSHRDRGTAPSSVLGRAAELHLMLGVVGAPLVPVPVPVEDRESATTIPHSIKQDPIEVSRAKYIVKQYAAAVGGEKAMGGVSSMYAMGKVRLMMSGTKSASRRRGADQVGGFVVWQKSPEVWCLELVVAGCKLAAGCDGRVAWRQAPWQYPRASRGPPRPLRRSLQGLDPRSTASLFSNAVWTGEKTTNGEACFVLRLDADDATCRGLSSADAEVVRHTMWGHFSQRTGLLVQLEDARLLRVIDPVHGRAVHWETNTESTIEDYRPVDGVHVAHAGRTAASLVRSRAGRGGHVRRTRSHVEEAWTIEEVGFNIHGLSMDCFLAPSDLREEKKVHGDVAGKDGRTRGRDRAVSAVRLGPAQVAAVDSDDSDLTADEDERL